MHDRGNVYLHDRFLLRRTSPQNDQRLKCPPWRHTSIPVELFDLMTAPPSMSIRLYRLHFEILQFYQYMLPTEAEHAVRQQVVNRITEVVNRYLPAASVDIYGSYKTKLYLPTSDIDLIIHSKDGRRWETHELDGIMSILRQAFCSHHICTEDAIQIINSATVPIIKLTDRKTDIKVDMSFNMNNGLRNAQLILHYVEAYPYLKYLAYVLKHYLLQLNLNEVWSGGISSYSLILMLVCFFQCYYKKDQDPVQTFYLSNLSTSFITTKTKINPIDDCSSYPSSSGASYISSEENNISDIDDEHAFKHVNLGHMLISFLELYGVYFNYVKLGIRVQTPYQPDRPAGFIDKKELFKNFCCGHRTINNLCIVDPFNDKNDISKASWLTPKLNSAFREAYDQLLQSISEQNTTLKNAPSILSKILTVNENIQLFRKKLRRIYREYQNEQRTVKHIQCGRLNYFSLDKPVIQYNNGNPLKYQLPYQQQFYSTQNGFHRSQSERTNYQRIVLDNEHENGQE